MDHLLYHKGSVQGEHHFIFADTKDASVDFWLQRSLCCVLCSFHYWAHFVDSILDTLPI